MNEKFIERDGVVLCTQGFGDPNNPALLLIAGATVSMLYWHDDFCRQLAANGLFVIRYDNRDVGRSTTYPPGTPPYTVVDMTDDAIAVLDGYQVRQGHLAGMSLGGLIAQIAAIRHPGRIASITLLATGPWGDSRPDIPEMDSRILDFQARAAAVDWTDEEAVVSYLVEGAALMTGRHPFDRENAETLARAEFNRAVNYLSMFNHAQLGGGEAYYNRLQEIGQPTLILHGTEDQIWHFGHTEVLQEQIRQSRLVTLEGSGHELAKTDWPRITQAIAAHVRATVLT